LAVPRGGDGRACNFFVPWDEAVRRLERAVAIIRASGRRVVFAIPPDKATIYPEYVPGVYKDKDCAARGRRQVWSALEGSHDPGILGLRKAMLAAKAPPPGETYYRNDTHWNTKGAILGLRAILERLGGPTQIRDDEIAESRVKVAGDLSKLMGAPAELDSPAWNIRRDAGPNTETNERLAGGGSAKLLTRPKAAVPLIPGRTLLIHDSYGDIFETALAAYTRELSIMLWFDTPPAAFIDAIRRSDTVIFEKVERDVDYYASDAGLFTPKFLDELRRGLARR
jgi:alginate O-acetyltransferase complex protein AlgJ